MPILKRASSIIALAGLIFVLLGLTGTARLFYENQELSNPEADQGFAPMIIELETGQQMAHRAPLMPTLPPAVAAQFLVTAQPRGTPTPRVTGTPFQPFVPPTSEAVEPPTQPVPSTPPLAESTSLAVESTPLAAVTTAPSAQPSPQVPATGANRSAFLPLITMPEPVLERIAAVPENITIPSINLEAPVVTVDAMPVYLRGLAYEQWSAPNTFAVGWHEGSAQIGSVGNTVLNGHHNIYGAVFANLKDVQVGAEILISGGEQTYRYVVAQTMLLPERDAGLAQRQENARWILPSDDERLTLVTCWPPESNTHRIIVVAQPVY